MAEFKLDESRLKRNPDGSIVLPLAKPATSLGGVRVTELKFREAVAEDLDAWDQVKGSQSGTRLLIARLAGLDVGVIDKLCLYDLSQASAVVGSFFEMPPVTDTSSSLI